MQSGLSYQQACIFISIFENVFEIDSSACAIINLYPVFYINMYGVFFEESRRQIISDMHVG